MRKWSLDHPRLWLVLMIAACLSLLPLAWLQYRWIGQITQADRERRQAHLETAVSRFVRDFDGEVGPVMRLLLFGPPVGSRGIPEGMAARYARFLEFGGEPRLIRNLYLSQGGEDGTLELFSVDLAAGESVPVAWAPELDSLRVRLVMLSRGVEPGFTSLQPVFEDHVLAVFAPRWQVAAPRVAPEVRLPQFSAVLAGWSIIELDLEFISKELLPGLVERHFLESGERGYQVRIVSRREPGRTIYTSNAALAADFFSKPDVSAPLLSLRTDRPPGFAQRAPGRPSFVPRWQRREWQPGDSPPDEPREARATWQLLVRHRAGSLEAAVAQTRHRNLALSCAILLLMTSSLAGLLVWTRRAQRLARMQMEFVAGVSHELRTPLSVICSAGDNLADGLVAGGPQVRRYGSVIRGEGRRLSRMVEKLMGFAGIQSGRASYELQPTVMEEVVAGAIAACEPDIRSAGCSLESQIEPDLPNILADPTSLTHCLRNLIDNALAHAGEGKWIGVRARAAEDAGGREVEIVIEDRGRGIDPRDLPRIFDPFYRGRRAIEDQVRGFGLGLTLAKRIVEAHSGKLTVESAPGEGTSFFVRIPAMPGSPAPSTEEDREPADSADRG